MSSAEVESANSLAISELLKARCTTRINNQLTAHVPFMGFV
jgi:hypothetical protein